MPNDNPKGKEKAFEKQPNETQFSSSSSSTELTEIEKLNNLQLVLAQNNSSLTTSIADIAINVEVEEVEKAAAVFISNQLEERGLLKTIEKGSEEVTSLYSKEAKEKTNTAIQAWSASELVLSTADWTYEWILLALGFLLFPFLRWLRKRIFGWKEINELQEWKEKYDNLKDEKKELKEKNADLEKELKEFQNDQLKKNKKKLSSPSDENETNST